MPLEKLPCDKFDSLLGHLILYFGLVLLVTGLGTTLRHVSKYASVADGCAAVPSMCGAALFKHRGNSHLGTVD